jgi:hypothetical protein
MRVNLRARNQDRQVRWWLEKKVPQAPKDFGAGTSRVPGTKCWEMTGPPPGHFQRNPPGRGTLRQVPGDDGVIPGAALGTVRS